MSATARTKDSRRATTRDQGRVLLVADDPAVSANAQALEECGLVVAGAGGGVKALVALQRTRPHVVVADEKVQGISAAELARMLSDAQDAIPVVLVGGERATTERRGEAMAAGAADYFQLPAELSLLIARTHQLVSHKLTVERLRAEADRDYLTGLANRRRFRKALGQEVERWRRYQVPCALLMLDVDHLKKINDTYGHPAGDRVIRFVAEALSELSRDNDTAARLGGEEFALLLAGVGSDRAVVAAERLRRAVCVNPLEEVGAVTISIGVAACPANAKTERELFTASDTALYRAKREGRNLVVLADGESEVKTAVTNSVSAAGD
ncbi:MAG TPA: diguanylate cyclase [Pyrinomonadaceae bacterium]|jgi:diguanylate cyclase (GGDEF)-like protein|nr:diguanylate cyclase [Pyrinomonadaceae bacterium]